MPEELKHRQAIGAKTIDREGTFLDTLFAYWYTATKCDTADEAVKMLTKLSGFTRVTSTFPTTRGMRISSSKKIMHM